MRRCCCLLMVLAACGCTPDYPFDKPGTWHIPETSSNDDNLRAMIVNPRDLVQGTSDNTTMGPEAAAPVRRLLTGKRYPLPVSTTQQFITSPPGTSGEAGQNAGQ